MKGFTRLFFFGLLCTGFAENSLYGQILTNGSFEVPVVPISTSFLAGSNAITGWTIGGNSVDIQADSFYQQPPLNPSNHCYSGTQCIDLDGSPGPGSVSQSFLTTPGQRYQLSFAYSRNIYFPNLYAADPSIALITVNGAGLLLSQTVQSQLPGPDLIWTPVRYEFTADSSTSTLTFASDDGPGHYGGIEIDGVEIQLASVPEPSAVAMGLICCASLSIIVWQRFRSKIGM